MDYLFNRDALYYNSVIYLYNYLNFVCNYPYENTKSIALNVRIQASPHYVRKYDRLIFILRFIKDQFV